MSRYKFSLRRDPSAQRKAFLDRCRKRETLIETRRKQREEKIKREAWLLWNADGQIEGRDDYYWRKAEERLRSPLLKIYISVEHSLENFLVWLKNQATFGILEILGSITILIALISFIATEQQRHNIEVYQAWQVVTAANGQAGDGGRKNALEFLNSTPGIFGRRRFPFFWLTWNPQDLSGLEAPKSYLANVRLPGATLINADFQDANLVEADFQSVDLRYANLQRANLWGINFQNTNLEYSNFSQARLWGSNLEGANLTGADFSGSDLRHVKLRGANLTGANLQKADLSGADLYGANLVGANLEKSNLMGANLEEVSYEGTVVLPGLLVKTINLKGVVYTNELLDPVICNFLELSSIEHSCPTRLPQGLNPQTQKMILIQSVEAWGRYQSELKK